tara:strand:+ start:5888 stop:6796 length:909 start_codon:yes stop_codon:yes gene_type:complete
MFKGVSKKMKSFLFLFVVAFFLSTENSHSSIFPAKKTVSSEEGRAPTIVYAPRKISKGEKLSLIISLHGYSSNPSQQRFVLPLNYLSSKRKTIVAVPSGIKDKKGKRFWSGLNCCDGHADQVPNDVSFLRSIINKLKKEYPINEDKIFVAGFSNGGFMAYRMACEASDLISGVVSFAGSGPMESQKCEPIRPLKVLHIHSTKDKTILFEGSGPAAGGPFEGSRWHPSAYKTVSFWEEKNLCSGGSFQGSSFRATLGRKINVKKTHGCQANGKVEFWTIDGASHYYYLGLREVKKIYDFFEIK